VFSRVLTSSRPSPQAEGGGQTSNLAALDVDFGQAIADLQLLLRGAYINDTFQEGPRFRPAFYVQSDAAFRATPRN